MNNTAIVRRFSIARAAPSPARVFLLPRCTAARMSVPLGGAAQGAPPRRGLIMRWHVDRAIGRLGCRWQEADSGDVVDLAKERRLRALNALIAPLCRLARRAA